MLGAPDPLTPGNAHGTRGYVSTSHRFLSASKHTYMRAYPHLNRLREADRSVKLGNDNIPGQLQRHAFQVVDNTCLESGGDHVTKQLAHAWCGICCQPKLTYKAIS